MFITLKPEVTAKKAKQFMQQINAFGLEAVYLPQVDCIKLTALESERNLLPSELRTDPRIADIKLISTSYKLVSRELHSADSHVMLGNTMVGGGKFTLIAGPCSVESHDQLMGIANMLTAHPVTALRGGAFKPRSSPYSFQGLGVKGLKLLKEANKRTNFPIVSEIIDASDAELMAEYVDCFQIGTRNMQNFRLLETVGKLHLPILLKRGMSATLEELLLAAEYIVNMGNSKVILCERGIRTFENATRNTLDLNAVAYLKQKTHLPVLVDPSHGTGMRELIAPLSNASAAVGADGILVETHLNPCEALSDGHQSLNAKEFAELISGLAPFVRAAGKYL